MLEANETTTEQPAEPAAEQQTESLMGNNDSASYYLMEGIAGAGDKPEWFLGEKYTSVAEQAKAYTELNKKFGSFTGAPKDGYQLPEGFDADDALAQEVIKFGTESNLNQDGFNKLMELASTQAQVTQEVNQQAELKKLGDNAPQRIKQLEVFLRDKMGEGYDGVRDLITDANGVMLAESIMKAMQPAPLPIDGVEVEGKPTWSDIEAEMFKTDEHGNSLRSIDPNHEAKVQKMLREFGGDKPNIRTFG